MFEGYFIMNNDVLEQLKQRVAELEKQVSLSLDKLNQQDQAIQQKDRLIDQLQEALKLAYAKRFGRSSESYVDISDLQFSLFDEAETGAVIDHNTQEIVIETHTRQRNRGKRQALPSYLPREIIECTISDEQLQLENGLRYEVIGYESSERLDIIPADVKILQYHRYKYAVKGHEEYGVLIAPIKGQLIAKGIATNGLLAHIAQAKYQHHLPLYRQEKIWQELEVSIPRSSMCRWMQIAGEAVQPVVDDIMAQVQQQPYIQVDETPTLVLKGKHNDNTTQKGFMWVYGNYAGCVYRYEDSRAGAYPLAQLQDYQGYVQSDGYSGYNPLFTPQDNRIAVGCWAHVRRKFKDIIDAQPKNIQPGIAEQLLTLIQKLYAIERKATKDGRTVQQLTEIRQKKSKPILDNIKTILDDVISRTPPKGLLGKAVTYTLNQWSKLIVYIEQGYIPIDNNAAENNIRPFALGRKNWLFSGHADSAQASANLFTLIENAKLYNLKVFDYLKYVFDRIGDAKTDRDYEQLTPKYAKQFVPSIKSHKKATQ
jgi:transposase